MKFTNLFHARLKKRYKRFLVDVYLDNGTELTAHCPNTGSMRGCLAAGNPVLLSYSDNPGRKYPYTLEMIQVNQYWVGVNTGRTNYLVREALENGIVSDLGLIDQIRQEVKVSENSRLDFLLNIGEEKLYMEAKNCTLVEDGKAMFPDAVTSRGTKHLHELAQLVSSGNKAAVFFCVQRMDCGVFSPAAHIDPLYSQTLSEVHNLGVKILAYQAHVSPEEIKLTHALPIQLA